MAGECGKSEPDGVLFADQWNNLDNRAAHFVSTGPEIWWQTFADLGIDTGFYSQRARPVDEKLPWDHINVKKGREYLEKEQNRSLVQLAVMAEAT